MTSTPPVASPEEQANFTAYGIAEIIHLATLEETPASAFSLAMLNTPEGMLENDVDLAGASTLLARDLLVSEGRGQYSPGGVAIPLAYALSHAETWTSFGFVRQNKPSDAFIVISAPELSVMVVPRPVMTYHVAGVEQESPADLVADVIEEQLSEAPDTTVYISVQHGFDTLPIALFVRLSGETDEERLEQLEAGVFEVAYGAGVPVRDAEVVGTVDPEGLDELIERLFTDEPQPNEELEEGLAETAAANREAEAAGEAEFEVLLAQAQAEVKAELAAEGFGQEGAANETDAATEAEHPSDNDKDNDEDGK